MSKFLITKYHNQLHDNLKPGGTRNESSITFDIGKLKTAKTNWIKFLDIARSEINSEITPEDVREMIIQHILTEVIFTNVFGDADFHKFNNIAKKNKFADYKEQVIDLLMRVVNVSIKTMKIINSMPNQ